MLSSANATIKQLKEYYYSLYWFQKLFFPSSISKILKVVHELGDNSDHAYDICKNYKAGMWFFQRLLFSCFEWFETSDLYLGFTFQQDMRFVLGQHERDKFKSFKAIVYKDYTGDFYKLLRELQEGELFSGDFAQANFEAIINTRYTKLVSQGLRVAQKAGLLTGDYAQANFDAILNSVNLEPLCGALKQYQQSGLFVGIFAQACFEAIVKHRHPYNLVSLFICFQNEYDIQTDDSAQTNFASIVSHEHSYEMLKALLTIEHINDLLPDDSAKANRDAILNHSNIFGLSLALQILEKINFFVGDCAQTNFEAIASHPDPCRIEDLYYYGLLTGSSGQENFEAFVEHQFADPLIILHLSGLLEGESAQSNRDALVKHDLSIDLSRVMEVFYNSGLLAGESAQKNYENFILPYAGAIAFSDVLSFGQENITELTQYDIDIIIERAPSYFEVKEVIAELLANRRNVALTRSSQSGIFATETNTPSGSEEPIPSKLNI